MNEARSLMYSIIVEANTAQAEANIRNVTSSLGSLQNSAEKINIEANTTQAEHNIRNITGDIGGLETQASSLSSAFRSSFLESIDSGNTFSSSLKSGVAGAFDYVSGKAIEFKQNVSQGIQNIENGLTHPVETIKGKLGNALQDVKDKFIEMARGAEQASNDTNDMGSSAEDAEKNIKELGDATEKSGDKFKKFGSILKGIGVAVGASIATVGAFTMSSIGVGMEFDTSMSQVAATMGYSVEELNTVGSEASQTFEQLRGFAMEMGANTAFSASQAADALNYMALAGYDANTSMIMLPNVLNLAAAGGIELADASNMITDAQSALGLTLSETNELVDKMAMTSSKSNTSVEELGNAILNIGGTAKNLAGGTTELNAVLGILADNSIKGAEGGTHLRNIILALGSPTDTAAEALSKLGVEVYDAEGKMKPFNETFGNLNEALSTMSQGDKLAAISDIFNTTDIAAVNALLDTSAERWSELTEYINDAEGAAGDMANTQLDNLAGDITLFKSALEGAQIVISDQLNPTLRNFVQFGSNAISTLSAAFQESGLNGAMSALGTILSDGLAMIIGMLPTVMDASIQLLGALGQGILNNLPMLIGATSEIIITLATGIGTALPELIPSIIDTLLLVISTIIENLPLLLDAGMQIISGLTEGIMNAIPILIERLPELILQITGFLTENLPTILEQGSQMILTLAIGISEAIPQLIAQLPIIITGIVGFITENLPIIVEQGVNLTVQLAVGIVQAIPQLVAQLPQIISAIVGGLSQLPSMMIEIGGNVVKGLWNGISSMGSWLKEKVKSLLGGIVGGVKDLLGIHSPSTVFAGIGDNMALGLGVGFEKSITGVTKNIEKSIPSEFDLPSVNTPNIAPNENIGIVMPDNKTYTISPIIEDAQIPTVSDIMYTVNPVVEEFNPPDVSDFVAYGNTSYAVNNGIESNNTEYNNTTPFAPIINITVEGNADEKVVDNIRTTFYDTIKELFDEFRKEELERMALKNEYAF